ncbi:hypothetical protein DB347_13145 [Opitutaceae bacterium EW11]|nr:hypothetical protein DB347_13145 [Opitutaceae bacterium EW11]
MKRSLTRLRDLLLTLAASAAAALALDDADWKFRQPFELERAGVVKIAVPLETLDKLEPDLRDLRIVGPDGAEVAFALVRPFRQPVRWSSPKTMQVRLEDDATVVTLQGEPGVSFDAVELITAAVRFLKPVRIETSSDGEHWQTQADGVPFFRQFGASQTVLPLAIPTTGWLRVTIKDRRQDAIAISGVRLREPAAEEMATDSVPIRISRTDTYAAETVVTIDLPAANLELKQLQIQTPDVLFTRPVRTGFSRFSEGEAQEQTLSSDTVYRVQLDETAKSEKTALAVGAAVPSRELLLHIENGDSPALRVDRIETTRIVTFAVFAASVPGRYECLSGNPRAAAPRYDVAALASQVRNAPQARLAPQPIAQNPKFHAAEPLAGIALEGGALNPASWRSHRAVRLDGAGVYRLELDLAALSTSSRSLADVRLARGDKQVPYLVENTSLQRSVELTATPDPDRERPTVSRWKVNLPRRGARLSGLVLQSSTRLFERQIRILEKRISSTGEPFQTVLAEGHWRRLPQDTATALTLALSPIETGTLWIETENGDNPAIDLAQVRANYPVSRLIFRSDRPEGVTLLTGNTQAAAPRYDLSLVAGALLGSEKLTATLAADDLPAKATDDSGSKNAVYFWAALAVVVVILLVVVAKLLPKPPAA